MYAVTAQPGPRLILVSGISGSGKSTAARQIQSEFGGAVVSRDDLRLAMFNKDFGPPVDEDLVSVVEFAALRASLAKGLLTISDNTNLIPAGVIDRLNIAAEFNAETLYYRVDCALDIAKEQNRLRGANGGRFVPPHVIEAQHANFEKHKQNVFELVNHYNTNRTVK